MEIIIGIAFWGGLVLAGVLFVVIAKWRYNQPHRVREREDAYREYQRRQERERYQRELAEKKRREGYYTKSGQWVAHSEYVNWEVIYRRDGNKCHICGKAVNKRDFKRTSEGRFVAGPNYPTVDHVIPKSKGGSHDLSNLKLAHKICNARKSASMKHAQ